MLVALLIVGCILIGFGGLVLLRYPDRPGGQVEIRGVKVHSTGAGLPITVLGVATIVVASVVATNDGRGDELPLGDQSSSSPQPPTTRETTSSTWDSKLEPGATSDSGETTASETTSASSYCIEDYLDQNPQVDEITTSRLPEGRTAENLPIRTSSEQPSALLLVQGSDTIGAIRLYWFQGIGLEIIEMVDAECYPVEWESHQIPTVYDAGVALAFVMNGQPFELSIEASSGLILKATLIAA